MTKHLDTAAFNLAIDAQIEPAQARAVLQIALDPPFEERGVIVDPQNLSPQIKEMRRLSKDDVRELYVNDPAMLDRKKMGGSIYP